MYLLFSISISISISVSGSVGGQVEAEGPTRFFVVANTYLFAAAFNMLGE